MGLFSKFKKKPEESQALTKKPGVQSDEKKKKKTLDEVSMADLYAGKETVKERGKKSAQHEEKKRLVAKPIKGDTREAYRVLIKPVVSEKASYLGQYNQYVFEVAPKANKLEVKRAIKALYGVDPIKINMIKISGKGIRSGRSQGRTKNWKKAVVILRAGQSIQVYEGV